eukprot:gene25238-33764_t
MEFMREKEEKKKLEQRIAMLMGQMIRGDGSGGNGPSANNSTGAAIPSNGSAAVDVGPELQVMIKEQQDKLRKEYETKLAGLERERETIEEEKAQVDRYKQLLLKQRDIMIALTQRLVERDEQIMSLQDELDAYDRHHKELEEKLDEKTALLIKFQRISMEVNMQSPTKNEELSVALSEAGGAQRLGDDKLWPRKGQSQQATELINESTTNGGDLDDESAYSSRKFNGSKGKADKNTAIINAIRSEFESAFRRMGSNPNLQEQLSHIMDGVVDRLKEDTIGQDFSTEPRVSAELEQIRAENHRLRAMNRQLEEQAASKENDFQGNGSNQNPQIESLQVRCDTLVKEREAVQTIMEHKIKVLVQSVAQAAANMMAASNAGTVNRTAGQDLTKDLSALQRLVNASIAALKNAASSDSSSSSSSSSSSAASSHNASSSSIGNASMKSNMSINNSNSYSNYYPNPTSQPPIPPYSSGGGASYSSYGSSGGNMNDTSSSMPPPVRVAPQVPNLNSTTSYPTTSAAAGSWGEQDSYFSASRSMDRRS